MQTAKSSSNETGTRLEIDGEGGLVGAIRVSKLLLVVAVSALHLVIALNNLTDYHTNYVFLQHVLAMDTVPSSNPMLRWRAISSVPLIHLAYVGVICAEATTAALCGLGAIRCLRSTRNEARFQQGAKLATFGLLLGSLLWLLGFLTIGGEWFVMWQSPTWNGQASAERMFIVTVLVLIFFCQSDGGVPSSRRQTSG